MTHHWTRLPLVIALWITWLPLGTHALLLDHDFSDMTIECDPAGVLLTINATALRENIPGMDTGSLRVGQGPWLHQCRPNDELDHGRGIRSFNFSYGDCHPRMEDLTDRMLKLTFDVIGDVADKDDDTPEGASISCMIPKDGLIGAHIEEDTNTFEYAGSAEGPFQLGITIYKDAFMTSPVLKGEEIHLGTPLWVGLKLNSSSNSEMFVRDCWANPDPGNSDDQPEHLFIKRGLIGEDDETFQPMDDVITATTYGFGFDSFMFRGGGSRVFIKCNIHICDPFVTDSDQSACSIPKYPEFHMQLRDETIVGSGSGSGFGIDLQSRDVGIQPAEGTQEDVDDANDMNQFVDTNTDEDEEGDSFGDDDNSETDGDAEIQKRDTNGAVDTGDGVGDLEERAVVNMEVAHPVYFVMTEFTVKHVERKRRSAGSYRIYPRHTMFSNLRSGIMLGIIIASTAMFSACAILLPLHLSGEKVRCLHVKPVKRVV